MYFDVWGLTNVRDLHKIIYPAVELECRVPSSPVSADTFTCCSAALGNWMHCKYWFIEYWDRKYLLNLRSDSRSFYMRVYKNVIGGKSSEVVASTKGFFFLLIKELKDVSEISRIWLENDKVIKSLQIIPTLSLLKEDLLSTNCITIHINVAIADYHCVNRFPLKWH